MTAFKISDTMTDAELGRGIGKALRAGGALFIEGEMRAALQADASTWITILARSRMPVSLALSGEFGPRGVALALLADLVSVSDATGADGAHRGPLIAALAANRMGQVAARAFLAEPCPLTALGAAGVLHSGAADLLARYKSALVAAAELPFDEAIAFAALTHANQDEMQ
ncbi:hypothetical protein [Roseovarius indicus]|uniref:Uncharacterized protein n=1 Tax=Roseovarius indicus TaxID=540747 RepID=A0A0T5PC08_9RHOB|nr:hypothetical protein [Roseovarius indicus]KRS18643.1 hypothetical protein XM52_07680 [Roseovarius indicus]QEW25682.1 hypothetical protein RIdsm_01469 [Roseovarius indicus]SFE00518.1 hypothetical protein SAMN04488031_10477 [Roseovarius indicus]